VEEVKKLLLVAALGSSGFSFAQVAQVVCVGTEQQCEESQKKSVRAKHFKLRPQIYLYLLMNHSQGVPLARQKSLGTSRAPVCC
jgi:hypothetical protein